MKFPYYALFLILVACTEKVKVTTPDSAKALGLADILPAMNGTSGWVTTFTSRGGSYAGMDSDSSITFYDGGRVLLTEYGYAPVDYRGTYEFDEEGEITLDLKEYPKAWPKMRIKTDNKRILLYRSDDSTKFDFGGRAGAVVTPEMAPFWPFGLSALSWPEPEPYSNSDSGGSKIFPDRDDL